MAAAADLLLSRVEVVDDCWIWTGRTYKGYPVCKLNGQGWFAHRLAHTTWIGLIPEGYEVDHLCFVPLCIKPAHLEAVTPAENQRRARLAGRFQLPHRSSNRAKTQCKRGHPLAGDNLKVVHWRGKTMRQCRACKALHNAARYPGGG